jgi:hypothetical protein
VLPIAGCIVLLCCCAAADAGSSSRETGRGFRLASRSAKASRHDRQRANMARATNRGTEPFFSPLPAPLAPAAPLRRNARPRVRGPLLQPHRIGLPLPPAARHQLNFQRHASLTRQFAQ